MRFTLTSALRKALVVAALAAAVAFSPVSAQVNGIHKAIRAGWTKFLDEAVPPAKLADELAAAGGGKAASLARLVDEAAEVRKFLDDRAASLVSDTPGAAAAVSGKTGLPAVAAAIDPSVGTRVPASVDNVVNAITILSRQAETAKFLNNGRMPAGFEVPAGAGEVLEAVAKRTQAQKAAGGGHMWRRTDGFYMSIAENKRAAEVLDALRVGDKSKLTTAELRELRDAMQSGADGSKYQRALAEAAAAGDGKVPAPALADNTVARPRTSAARTLVHVRRSYRRADYEATTGAGDLIRSSGQRGLKTARYTDADAMYTALAKEADEALKEGSSVSLGPSADKVLDALQTKASDIAEARRLNGGNVPSGVKMMTDAEKALMEKLEAFFKLKPTPMQDAAGFFYSRATMAQYEKLLDALKGSPDQIRAYLGSGSNFRFAQSQLKFYDTEMERSVRRAFKYATRRLPDADQSVTRSVTHSAGDGRVHGTGGWSTLINYPDSYTSTRVVFDAKWLDEVLTADPVYRQLDNPSQWNPIPVSEWKYGIGYANFDEQAAAMFKVMESALAKLKSGAALSADELARVRKAVEAAPPKDLQDVALANAARARDDIMLRLSKPNELPAAAWPTSVARKSDVQLAREAAEKAARDKELTEAAERLASRGKTLDGSTAKLASAQEDASAAMAKMGGTGSGWEAKTRSLRRTLAEAMKDGKESVSDAAEDLSKALAAKKRAYDDVVQLNSGTVPSSSPKWSHHDQELLDELRKFLDRNPAPAGGGKYYPLSVSDSARKLISGEKVPGASHINKLLSQVFTVKSANAFKEEVRTAVRALDAKNTWPKQSSGYTKPYDGPMMTREMPGTYIQTFNRAYLDRVISGDV